uniref:Uncharacterized protein n=3 Tax=Aegilops tauschii subsp. strangulata TaxID=200361 RepID=A0A453SLA3_AEGTS
RHHYAACPTHLSFSPLSRWRSRPTAAPDRRASVGRGVQTEGMGREEIQMRLAMAPSVSPCPSATVLATWTLDREMDALELEGQAYKFLRRRPGRGPHRGVALLALLDLRLCCWHCHKMSPRNRTGCC